MAQVIFWDVDTPIDFMLFGKAIEVVLVTDATRAIDAARGETLVEEWRGRGVRAVTTADALAGAASTAREAMA
jgi:hypothetical protein